MKVTALVGRKKDNYEVQHVQRLIETDDEYNNTLREIESLMYAEFDTLSNDHLDALVTLLEVYEHEQFPSDENTCK